MAQGLEVSRPVCASGSKEGSRRDPSRPDLLTELISGFSLRSFTNAAEFFHYNGFLYFAALLLPAYTCTTGYTFTKVRISCGSMAGHSVTQINTGLDSRFEEVVRT